MMNAKPEETLVFEDILVAIKTAHNAGFKAVAVYDKSSKNDMDDILKSADFFVSSYNEVLEEN